MQLRVRKRRRSSSCGADRTRPGNRSMLDPRWGPLLRRRSRLCLKSRSHCFRERVLGWRRWCHRSRWSSLRLWGEHSRHLSVLLVYVRVLVTWILTGCGLCGFRLYPVVGPIDATDSTVHVRLRTRVLVVLIHESSVTNRESPVGGIRVDGCTVHNQ